MKKFFAFLLAVAIFCPCFVACDKALEESTPSESETPSSPEVSDEDTAVTDEPDESQTESEEPAESQTESKEPVETTPDGEIISNVDPADILKNLVSNVSPFKSSSTGCKEVVLNDISKDTVLDAFIDEDFIEIEVDCIEGAKFETVVLVRSAITVTLYCDEANNEVRVMWESNVNNDVLKKTDETNTGSIIVAQVGTERIGESDNPLNGMCYAIKLSNGNAVIIDGGFMNSACTDNLYNTLEKLEVAKSDDKYVIEAWIITHAHGDHGGAYYMFASRYSDKAMLKNIIVSYPPSDDLITDGGKYFTAGKFKEASIITPHAGLKYYFGNATISMYYSPDMIYAKGYTIDYFNDSSLVFKIEGGGSSVMFLGDAGETVSTKLMASYDVASFKSDIFQLSHHGLYTSANSTHRWENLKKFYEAIDADYVFLPMHERLESDSRNGRYTVLVTWARVDHQIAFVMNTADNHGISDITQAYYNSFVESVKNGTAAYPTLFGYDGINKIVNAQGLVTYLGGNEIDPMITVFEFANNEVTLKNNQPLHDWCGK